jgi:hypothetical protein
VMAYNDDGPRPGATEGQEKNEPSTSLTDSTNTVKDPGFWAKVGQGKPRPAPREPDITHYRNRGGDPHEV